MVQKPLIKQGYSLAEEIANSVSHGIGLVFGIVGLVLLLVQAVDLNASATAITSYSQTASINSTFRGSTPKPCAAATWSKANASPSRRVTTGCAVLSHATARSL